ncbi:unnamed protein product [marine sediment metagenome]|uniref:Uncharacterized protein n=1 Tax=marine sediment metagenome TaxID=412755 RepID=X0WRR3_9ZZZZ
MFRSNSQKRVEEVTEEAAEFFKRRDKIEKILIIVFTVIITGIIAGFLIGMQ